MEKSNGRPFLPPCMMLHEVVNKLSIIIGNCDLVIEKSPADSECIKRLQVIGGTARAVVRIMQGHQCELTGLLRTAHIETADHLQPLEPVNVNDGRKNPSPADKTGVHTKHHHQAS
jgi:hypothetical protein